MFVISEVSSSQDVVQFHSRQEQKEASGDNYSRSGPHFQSFCPAPGAGARGETAEADGGDHLMQLWDQGIQLNMSSPLRIQSCWTVPSAMSIPE